MKNYILDGRYKDLLLYHGINVEEVLRKAQLPTDALNHRIPTMTEEGYYRFMTAIGELSEDDALPIKLSCTNRIEAFSPPIFAAYCSKNGAACIERLARYKRLIGPMRFIVSKDAETMTVVIEGDDEDLTQPMFLVSCEIAFLTHIIRRATKEEISPVSVEMRELPKGNAVSEFLNCPINNGKVNSVTCKSGDLLLPFISYGGTAYLFLGCALGVIQSVAADVYAHEKAGDEPLPDVGPEVIEATEPISEKK